LAKKKAVISLRTQDIMFTLEKSLYKVLQYNPNNMTLHVSIEDADGKREMKDFPFAHAPKEIKKLIKPN
jgi:hypothetical protein